MKVELPKPIIKAVVTVVRKADIDKYGFEEARRRAEAKHGTDA